MTDPAPSRARRRILFVCYGNICRSPMAEAIALRKHGGRLEAESCGVGAVRGTPATPEAVLAVKTLFGADASRHAARPIEDLDPGRFDAVVAMDFPVYGRVRRSGLVPEDRLYVWDIEDPLGRGYEAFKQTAGKIAERLEQLLESWEGE